MAGFPTSRRGGRQRSSIKMRLIIGLVIAAIAFVGYLSKGEINPITGEKQRVSLTPKEEIVMGMQAAPEMAAEFGGLHRDQQAQQLVDRIGEELVRALNESLREEDKDNPYRFEFHLLADPKTVNAFALPGGQVFITAALFEQLETEGQLAGVLGHEVGHVLSRHSAQRMAKQELTQGLVGAAGVAGGGQSSAQMAAMVGNMINMKYGRGDELESDRWGVKLLPMAGYDPRAMIGVMKVLERAAGGNRQPEMLSTHPNPGNRAEKIEQFIQEFYPQGLPEGLKE